MGRQEYEFFKPSLSLLIPFLKSDLQIQVKNMEARHLCLIPAKLPLLRSWMTERRDRSAEMHLNWWYHGPACAGGRRSDENGLTVGLVLVLPDIFNCLGNINVQR